MKYKLKRFSNTILKDFPQEEVYKFINCRGTELYDECKEKSVNDINSSNIKKGKFNITKEIQNYQQQIEKINNESMIGFILIGIPENISQLKLREKKIMKTLL